MVRSVRCLCGFGPLPRWSFTLGGNGNSPMSSPPLECAFSPFLVVFLVLSFECVSVGPMSLWCTGPPSMLYHLGWGGEVPSEFSPQNPVFTLFGVVSVSVGPISLCNLEPPSVGSHPGWEWEFPNEISLSYQAKNPQIHDLFAAIHGATSRWPPYLLTHELPWRLIKSWIS